MMAKRVRVAFLSCLSTCQPSKSSCLHADRDAGGDYDPRHPGGAGRAGVKNLGKSNAALSASRQMLDAVGRARQLAIANHTTVYMVFVPANFWTGMNMNIRH